MVRAPAPALVAGEPLREPVRVEVYDARGRPAPGAVVEWRVVSGGGSVAPTRGSADGEGVAEAAWAPGPTADRQRLVVAVPHVGEVELSTAVAVATVSVQPRTVTLWPGDTAVLRADLADAAGNALSGGAPRWDSSDTAVALVSPRGVVTARGAGGARVSASVPGASSLGAAAVAVLPALAGRLVAPRGAAPLPRATLVVRAGGRADSTVTDDAGRFLLRLPAVADDVTTEVLIRPTGPGADRYHRARVRASSPRELATVRVVLVPTAWTIAAGRFAGRTVPISPAAATARAGEGSRFWRLERAEPRSTWVAVGWEPAALPVRVLLRRGPRSAAIAPSDSAAFWRVARALERDIGAPLFTPATWHDEEDERGAITVEVNPRIDAAGFTLLSWGGSGSINDATVSVRSAARLGDPAVTAHELLHALGIGHTRAWPSLMGSSVVPQDYLTPEDVAYAQLLLAIRQAERDADAPYGVVEAADAELGAPAPTPPARRDGVALP